MIKRSVFLSSTARDLSEHRNAVYEAIEGLDHFHCVRMEDFGARDATAEELCREKVAQCDLFVGIVGHLYGSTPTGGTASFTIQEHSAAIDAAIPRLMFVAPDDFQLPATMIEPDAERKKQQAFRKQVLAERVVDSFSSPQNLALSVVSAIRNWELRLDSTHTDQEPVRAVEKIIRDEMESILHNLRPRLAALMAYPAEQSATTARKSDVGNIVLAEKGGVLQWQQSQTGAESVVAKFRFEKVTSAQTAIFLDRLDATLRPQRGLLAWDGSRLRAEAVPPDTGRVLLFVHGTFGSSDLLFDDLQATQDGQAFLKTAGKFYDQVCAFDYSSLSDTPLLTALDLDDVFRRSEARIDVISHGGGGLVTRWLAERIAGSGVVRKAVLVGCPLAGTSLATRSIASCLGWLTNVSHALPIRTHAGQNRSAASNLTTIIAALMRVALSQRTPDDVVSVVTSGLGAQSCSMTNREMSRLQRKNGSSVPVYYAVQSSFRPEAAGWEFWRHWRAGRDDIELVFAGDNDLVVDTASMTDLGEGLTIPASHVFSFGANDFVHHFNYFRQPHTIHFLRQCLQLP